MRQDRLGLVDVIGVCCSRAVHIRLTRGPDHRSFPRSERQRPDRRDQYRQLGLRVRGECFNVFNPPNFGAPMSN